MILSRYFALAGALAMPLTAADEAPPPDLLRLDNGELEGRFAGIDRDGVLSWERDDGIEPMKFRPDKVRQIVLRGASPLKSDASTSHVEMVNGDRFPATIVGLDEENLSIESAATGPMLIPRDSITRLAPNPFGGRLIYAGPFNADEWRIEDGRDEAEGEEKADDEASEKEDEDAPTWRHIGSRWYSTNSEEAILLEAGMPEISVLSFKAEWRGRSPINIAFHSDFALPPEVEAAGDDEPEAPDEDADEQAAEQPDEEDDKPTKHVRTGNGLFDFFGNAFVLTVRGNYMTLHRCGYNEDGQPYTTTLRSSARSVRLEETGEALFEIRSNLEEGFIALFVDGEFLMQWPFDEINDDHPFTPGGGIGFRMDGTQDPLRLSEIIVAEWNGMPDSARSLASETRDIVLLTNGTDRFSGEVQAIRDGSLELQGEYAPLTIPLAEIAEVRFASEGLREDSEDSDTQVRVHFQPIGRITGEPGMSTESTLSLRSPLLGGLEVQLDNAVVLEFQDGNRFLNIWDDDL